MRSEQETGDKHELGLDLGFFLELDLKKQLKITLKLPFLPLGGTLEVEQGAGAAACELLVLAGSTW